MPSFEVSPLQEPYLSIDASQSMHVRVLIATISNYCIAGNFRWVLFSYGEPQNEKLTNENLGYYDDVLRAYNENKTMKIRFQGLITKI